jgi:predicted nucleotidyltransferase
MKETILEQLTVIEQKQGVKILFACESGSRAWGFASPDSDYDVRFIYARPQTDYLGIRNRKDVIDLPVNPVLDINGWDIRKALQLFLKSNPPLYEWLQSPIVYKEEGGFARELRQHMPGYFSHRAGCHHYLSMARNTLENHLQGDQLRLKKYFYALRPALACGWILEKNTLPPMEFSLLRTLVTDAKWNEAVVDLLQQKRQAGCGLIHLTHFRDAYLLFHEDQLPAGQKLRGIISGDTANDVQLSTVPQGISPLAVMHFNKDAYSIYCKEYASYWQWVEERNDERYQNTLSHGKNYDAKNMMHTFRLLAMAEEIALHHRVIVHREDRDFLLRIRAGEFEYEELMQMVEEKMARIEALYSRSDLPDAPDPSRTEELLVRMRETFY